MSTKNINIAFFGSSGFSMPCLQEIHKNFCVKVIYTQPPQKSGRGMKLTNTPTHNFAIENGIDVKHQLKLTQNDEIFLQGLNIHFIVVVSYGLILPQFILNTAKYAPLNIHPSSLPYFRGAAPIERTIESGQKTTNICIIKMVKQLDAGDILYKSPPINIEGKGCIELTDQFANEGAKQMAILIQNIYNGFSPQAEVQNSTLATYANKINKQDLTLPPQDALLLTTNQVKCKILAFEKHGITTTLLNRQIKVFSFINVEQIEALLKPNQLAKVVENSIKCSNGFVVPHKIIPHNGKQMLFKDLAISLHP